MILVKRLYNKALKDTFMKHWIARFALVVGVVAMLASCTTSQKFTVRGTPGTTIYYPNLERIGKIGADSTLAVKMPSKRFEPYLLSVAPDSTEFVPFALKFKHHNYPLSATAKYTGIVIGGVGTLVLVPGLICLGMCLDDSKDNEYILLGGEIMTAWALPPIAVGSALVYPANAIRKQECYKRRIKYLPEQHVGTPYTPTEP